MLLTYPNKFLLTRCSLCRGDSKGVIALLEEELEKHPNGLGLSANQIGINSRVCIIKDEDGRIWPLIDPFIKNYIGNKINTVERCLSFPGREFEVERYKQIAISLNNNVTLLLGGIMAIVAQHEIDHLDGKTILRNWCL